MKTENHIALPDGRKLAYAEFGKPDGFPVLYFHGTPSSRLEPLVFGDEAFSRLGLRLLAPDRPGMGASDFQRGRGFSDWPADLTSLANALDLETFSVLGNSGGGGYAAVCAARIPERLHTAVIVSGGWQMNQPEAMENLPAPNRLFFKLADKALLLLRLMLKMMAAPSQGRPEQQLARLKPSLHPADYVLLHQIWRLEAFNHMLREAMRQGTKGAAWDTRLFVREWDFRLDEIRMPLKLFHGEEDRNVPFVLVQKMIRQLPTAHLVTYQGEAHLSTFNNHLEEIAHALMNK